MQILIILSGLNGSPVNKIYFLQADTSSIQSDSRNYNNPARWTYLAICGVVDGKNGNCGPKGAAIPFDPERNFGTSNGVSENLLTDDNYYYLSRTAWAFYLVALFFAACALLVSLAAIIARLGAYFTGLFAFLACFFQALCSALMTYVNTPIPTSTLQVTNFNPTAHGPSRAATLSAPVVLMPSSVSTHTVSPGVHSPLSSSRRFSSALVAAWARMTAARSRVDTLVASAAPVAVAALSTAQAKGGSEASRTSTFDRDAVSLEVLLLTLRSGTSKPFV